MLRIQFSGGVYDGGALEIEAVHSRSRKASKDKPTIPAMPARIFIARDGSAFASVYTPLRNLSPVAAVYSVGAYVKVREIPRGSFVFVVS